jgi:hypothetical protein
MLSVRCDQTWGKKWSRLGSFRWERPKNDKTVTFKKKNIWSKVSYLGSTPRHTDWLTVSRNVTLTLTLTLTLTMWSDAPTLNTAASTNDSLGQITRWAMPESQYKQSTVRYVEIVMQNIYSRSGSKYWSRMLDGKCLKARKLLLKIMCYI